MAFVCSALPLVDRSGVSHERYSQLHVCLGDASWPWAVLGTIGGSKSWHCRDTLQALSALDVPPGLALLAPLGLVHPGYLHQSPVPMEVQSHPCVSGTSNTLSSVGSAGGHRWLGSLPVRSSLRPVGRASCAQKQ